MNFRIACVLVSLASLGGLVHGALVYGADSAVPLADAAQQQDLRSVRELLSGQIDIDQAQADGMTALHWSVYYDAAEMSQLLVGAGADVNVSTRYTVTPLSLACQNGNTAIVELLLEAGADPNTALPGGETVLMTASRTGRIGPVRALLARGASVDAKERNGQTSLMWAAAEGHVEVVAALIAAGAGLHDSLPSGFDAWFFAVREGRSEVVGFLLDAGADVNAALRPRQPAGRGPRSGTSALLLAVENGHFQLAAKLLDAGADANDARCGFTALHALTWVRKPIRGDGDPPPRGSGAMNSLDLVRDLVAHGADLNSRYGEFKGGVGRLNYTDATPFLLAAESGDVELLRLLLELGADPGLCNVDHCTPLLAATGVGVLSDGDESAGTEDEAIETVHLLLELGADINAVDDQGNSVMHGAAYTSWFKLIPLLAERGADQAIWNRKNRLGWTPLQIAQGHRPGNFRPSLETVEAIQRCLTP